MAGVETTKSIIKVHFELYARAVECVGVTWIDLNVNATIKEVKSKLLEGITSSGLSGPLILMFDGLLLEDDATLVGLGVVDGDTVYVSDNGVDRFRGIEMKSRIAEEISVGLNVLLGEAEHGFDVIPEDERKEKDSLSIPCCCTTCIYCIRELYLFKDRFDQAYLKSPQLMKNMPNFTDFISQEQEHENCVSDNWEYHENCVFDAYEDILDSFIDNLPEGSNILDYRKVMLELFPQDKSVKTKRRCPRDIHTNCTDPVGFYIGPTRYSNFSNYLAFPPTILLKVGKISDKTTLQDLLHSYQLYSEMKVLTSSLNYSNERFDLSKTVFEVIDSNAFLNNHYFSFPYDISKSEDTRCIDDLVDYIEGDGDAGIERKKRKKKRKKSSNQTSNSSIAVIDIDTRSPTNVRQGDEIEFVREVNQSESVRDNNAIQSGETFRTSGQYEALGAIPRRNNSFETNKKHGTPPVVDMYSSNEVPVTSSHSKQENFQKKKTELERRIAEEREHLLTHKQNVEDLIDKKAVEMKNVILLIDKSRDEKNEKMKGVARGEKDISELETRMRELNLEKRDLLEACDREDEKVLKYECKRLKLEGYIENELKKNKERELDIEVTIQNLETKLDEINNPRGNNNQGFTNRSQPVELNKQLLDFIDDQISEKEKELECPVCLEVAESPIFMCSELHLICCNCRPKLKACPECRIEYEGKPKRHRYAEKTAEELTRIKKQRDQIIKSSSRN